MKQYNSMKPIKRGYKLWMRVDMVGYISKFDVYQGKNTMPRNPDFPDCFGLGESVVAHFSSDLVDDYHEVYFVQQSIQTGNPSQQAWQKTRI